MRYLVVSSDAYNTAFGDRRVIAVEIDSRAVYHGAYREPIPDAGTAHLDRLTWVTRRQLTELVAELTPTATPPSPPSSESSSATPERTVHLAVLSRSDSL
jgi:hypothetical protein